MIHYTPDKTEAYERRVAACAQDAMGELAVIEGAASVRLDVLFEVPQSWSKAKRLSALDGSLMHTAKPDIDNVIKAVFDGFNGVIWVDDSQVCDLRATKGYSEDPRVDVTIEWL